MWWCRYAETALQLIPASARAAAMAAIIPTASSDERIRSVIHELGGRLQARLPHLSPRYDQRPPFVLLEDQYRTKPSGHLAVWRSDEVIPPALNRRLVTARLPVSRLIASSVIGLPWMNFP